MKRENMKRVETLIKQLEMAECAVHQINQQLEKYPDGSAPYDSSSRDGKEQMWGFGIGEHQDGEGFYAKLNGLEVSIEVIQFTKEKLEENIIKWNKELETL